MKDAIVRSSLRSAEVTLEGKVLYNLLGFFPAKLHVQYSFELKHFIRREIAIGHYLTPRLLKCLLFRLKSKSSSVY